MTVGLLILIGMVLGVILGFGLCAMLTVSREADERTKWIFTKENGEIEGWSEYREGQR